MSDDTSAQAAHPRPGKLPSSLDSPLPEFNAGLPRQANSSTAWAALRCRQAKPEHVPYPADFEASRKRLAPTTDARAQPEHYCPHDAQTSIVWDAFYQQRTVQVAYNEDELKMLRVSEKAELEAAVGHAPFHQDAAPPRKWALTALVRDVNLVGKSALFLLNSMAYIASFTCEGSGGKKRAKEAKAAAADEVRIAVLTGRNAMLYSHWHRVSFREDEHIALVLVHARDCGQHAEIVAHKVQMSAPDTGRKMYCQVTKKIAELFVNAGIADEQVPCTLLLPYNVSSDDLANAYEESMMSTNEAFWKQLVRIEANVPMDYKLCARHVVKWLKIGAKDVVDNSRTKLADENVFIGGLLHKKGQEEATQRFLDEVLMDEYSDALAKDPHKNPSDIFTGLRFPDRNINDHELGLHILEMGWEWHSLKHQLSSFGRIAAPGAPVCGKDGAMVPRLVYKLKAYDRANYGDYYVLPCPYENTLPLQEELAWTLWGAWDIGLRMCWDRFCDLPPVAMPDPRPLKAQRSSAPPSAEDALLSRMGGMPLCGAFRIGDVLAKLSECPNAPTYSKFLVSGISRLGPCKSMVDLYENCNTLHDTIVRLEAEKRQLEQALANAQAAPPAPVGPPPIAPSHSSAVKAMIRGLNLKKRGWITFTEHVDYEILARLVGRSNGDPDDAAIDPDKWVQVEAIDRASFPNEIQEHLAAVARCACPDQPIVAMMQRDNLACALMLYSPRKAKWKQISLERAMHPQVCQNSLYFHYTERTSKLLAYSAAPDSDEAART